MHYLSLLYKFKRMHPHINGLFKRANRIDFCVSTTNIVVIVRRAHKYNFGNFDIQWVSQANFF